MSEEAIKMPEEVSPSAVLKVILTEEFVTFECKREHSCKT